MDHSSRIVTHVKSLLDGSEHAELISNSIMKGVPFEEFEAVFDALDLAGFAWIWQFEILRVYRP